MKKEVLEKLKMRKLKKQLTGVIDEQHDKITAQSRIKWEDRWRARTEEITGQPCESWEDIAWDD